MWTQRKQFRMQLSLLDDNSNKRLAITSQGLILGYLGHHTLLKAAMKDREGELSV